MAENDKIKLFECHPDDPNPSELIDKDDRCRVDANAIRKGRFTNSVAIFVKTLKAYPQFEVFTRIFNEDDINPGSWVEIIPQCQVIIMVCCPGLVYLTSDQADKRDKLKEQYTVMELNAILGKNLVGNIRIIPVIINSTSDNITMVLPTNILACTHPIEIYIPDPNGDNEIWDSQNNPSILNLIKIIESASKPLTLPVDFLTLLSFNCELNQADQNLIMVFFDQFAIPYISHIFDTVLQISDKLIAMESHFQIPERTYATVKDLLRYWLRGLEHNQRKDIVIFSGLSKLFTCIGSEDLIFQVKYQWRLFKYAVWSHYSSVASSFEQSTNPPLSHPTSKP